MLELGLDTLTFKVRAVVINRGVLLLVPASEAAGGAAAAAGNILSASHSYLITRSLITCLGKHYLVVLISSAHG